MLKIRDLLPEEAGRVCDFKEESNKTNFPGCSFNREMYERILRRAMEKVPGCVKVAEADGEIAGFIWLRVMESTLGVFGRIEDVYVDSRHRKRGIGRKLMETAESYFAGYGIGKIKLTVTKTNKAGISLYESMGYETKRLRMEKDL